MKAELRTSSDGRVVTVDIPEHLPEVILWGDRVFTLSEDEMLPVIYHETTYFYIDSDRGERYEGQEQKTH